MGKNKDKDIIKHQNNSLMILDALLVFDLWLLLKTRWLMTQVVRVMIPIIKICFFMILGAGLVLTYAFTQTKFNTHNHQNRDFSCKTNNPELNKYLEVNDDSMLNGITLKKELVEIKNMKMNLQKSLFRMNLHLRYLYDQQKSTDTNLADFASEAIGGFVIDTPGTQSYYKQTSTQMTLFGIPIWRPNYFTPRKVIQPWTQPGECWAFRGSQGKIEIELAHAAIIDRVTLEHITASASITGNIDSAPKSFNVLGKVNNQFVMIGTYVYKNHGKSSQIFTINKPEIKNTPFKRVILEIVSNWGNPDYTCIYRFKVHGKMYIISNEKVNIKVQKSVINALDDKIV